MTYSLGIIPAAGKAERFGGVLKELLPVGVNGETLLHRTYRILRSVCNQVAVVTNPHKVSQQAATVPHALFLMQEVAADIWGAMIAGMRIQADRYYFAMPDTFIQEDAFLKVPYNHFCLGTFWTDRPERFGVLRSGRVLNKRPGLPVPATAWGALVWTKTVRDYWMSQPFETYTQAINSAMETFGFRTFELEFYYDNGTFTDYVELLRKVCNA